MPWIRQKSIDLYSNIDPHLSHYCLAVTSGSQPHPLTLCAAQNILRVHPHPTKGSSSSKEQQHRGIPEGLHCVRQTKLTLHRMKYDTTYNFTLYVVSNCNWRGHNSTIIPIYHVFVSSKCEPDYLPSHWDKNISEDWKLKFFFTEMFILF